MAQVMDADYIVIGGGSAGCVVANRLSARESNKVLLLEAGGDDRPLKNPSQFMSNLHIKIPAGWTRLMFDPKVNWNMVSEPDPSIGGRVNPVPRGKVLGGSSAINGIMYVRGLASDYEGWRQMGCTGWGWDDALRIFRRMENAQDDATGWHGSGGELTIRQQPGRSSTMDAVIAASVDAGYPATGNINGEVQEGLSYAQQNTRGGLRASSATAFLHPVEKRPNLHVVTQAQATRILIENGRAIGVEYVRNGQTLRAMAHAEVILCGGAINSPQLLELSGIGDGRRLQAMGIQVEADRRQVGENLQDHYTLGLQVRLKAGTPSLNGLGEGLPLAKQILRFALTRQGILSSAAGVVTGYMRSRPEVDIPDIQIMSSAATVDYEATAKAGKTVLEREPGLTIGGCLVRPDSRGSIHLKGRDPLVQPAIQYNFLSAQTDVIGTVNMFKLIRNLFRQPSLAPLVERELLPMVGVPENDDAAIADVVRQVGYSAYHAAGSCRMGADPESVVDPQLRVRGIEGLRVADASIMPRIVSGNTNAASMLIGERLGEMVLAEA